MLCIRPALQSEFAAITDVWEASVRATHDFLSADDLCALRPQILNTWLPAVQVTVCTDRKGVILGYSGVADNKLEMLFVTPAARGRGVGRALLMYAVAHMAVCLVDVNEQNKHALGFYQHFGFTVFGRSPVDAQGRAYPLLHMRRKPCSLVV
ncbi:MAG: acetyltransferase [Desulfobulbaceae bacterium]|nr:acetyltransferase [Desulfobulbaceae bacterium]